MKRVHIHECFPEIVRSLFTIVNLYHTNIRSFFGIRGQGFQAAVVVGSDNVKCVVECLLCFYLIGSMSPSQGCQGARRAKFRNSKLEF